VRVPREGSRVSRVPFVRPRAAPNASLAGESDKRDTLSLALIERGKRPVKTPHFGWVNVESTDPFRVCGYGLPVITIRKMPTSLESSLVSSSRHFF